MNDTLLPELSPEELKRFKITIDNVELNDIKKELFRSKFFLRNHAAWLNYLFWNLIFKARCLDTFHASGCKTLKAKLYFSCDKIRYKFNRGKQNSILRELGFKDDSEIIIRGNSKAGSVKEKITIAAVVGSPSKESFKKHVQALIYSTRDFAFKETIIFAPENMPNKYSNAYSWVKIKPMDYHGYNEFCIQELHKHIKTEYLLLIQDDGFVLNPGLWTDEFFNYDYIGAASPFKVALKKEFVYNGGFSLRSKKFMELSSHLKEIQTERLEEDRFIFKNHVYFLRNGIKLPPLFTASIFSNAYDNDFCLIKSFGFHGRMNPKTVSLKDSVDIGI
jgi:hypothetical protein